MDLGSKELNNSASVLPRIIQFYTDIQADLVNSHAGYDVTGYLYFRSAFIEVRITAENAISDSLMLNFSGVAFCLSHQLAGIW